VFKDLSTKDLMANAVEFVFLHSIVLLWLAHKLPLAQLELNSWQKIVAQFANV
jgi:hypothetical protein